MPQLSDIELLNMDLFHQVGLGTVPPQERVDFFTALEPLISLAATVSARRLLSEQDGMKLDQLMNSEDTEGARMFLAFKGIDMQAISMQFVLDFKRTVVERGLQFRSKDELRNTFKRTFSEDVLEMEIVRAQVLVEEFLAAQSIGDREKSMLLQTLLGSAHRNALVKADRALPGLLRAQHRPTPHQLLDHGVDYVELVVQEAQCQVDILNEELGFRRSM